MSLFPNRVEAGRQLAARLTHLADEDPLVLGIPRGGVPVAAEVARLLGAPLDVAVVRKLGVPGQPELAMGAVGEGGVRVLEDHVLHAARVTPEERAQVERRERAAVELRAERLRRGRTPQRVTGRTVVLVDDGIATGSTMRAACQVARRAGARRVVAAVPVSSVEGVRCLEGLADEVVALATPDPFWAVGEWYDVFGQVDDDEVGRLLDETAQAPVTRRGPTVAGDRTDEVVVETRDGTRLEGTLTLPEGAVAVVAFAHGSGSSRHSPRNRYVAEYLQHAGLGTLLIDLLGTDEELDRRNVFDVDLLGRRMGDVVRWLGKDPRTSGLSLGLFGASTGAAAALVAAAESGARVGAVVSRGGRPDLATPWLRAVQAPTLLVVGGRDTLVREFNEEAARHLRCPHELLVVTGATHLFEEAGTLDAVARLAADWFVAHLGPDARLAQ